MTSSLDGMISITPFSGLQSLLMNISEYKGDASGTTISSWRIQPSGCVIVEVYVPGVKLNRYLYVEF